MTKTVHIGLTKGGGIMGWLVRWITRSRYGHAMIRFEQKVFTAAAKGWGWTTTDRLTQPVTWFAFDVTDVHYAAMQQWCTSRLGWKYDWWSVIRFTAVWRLLFPSREAKRDRRKLFCSEGPYLCALEAGKVRLLGEVEAWEVAPGDYRFSSMLTRVRP